MTAAISPWKNGDCHYFLFNLADPVQPATGQKDYKKPILAAQQKCLSEGLTTAHDAGIGPYEIRTFIEPADKGFLKLWIYAVSYGVQYAKENKPHLMTLDQVTQMILSQSPGVT